MQKSKNEMVLVNILFKDIKTGVVNKKDVVKHIKDIDKKILIKCPECHEIVKNHNDHYEHYSRQGKPCSFKTI